MFFIPNEITWRDFQLLDMVRRRLQDNGGEAMTGISKDNAVQTSTILAGYKDLLSVKDLCRIFEISKQTVYREIQRGKFGDTIRIGRAHKVPKAYVVQRYFSNF